MTVFQYIFYKENVNQLLTRPARFHKTATKCDQLAWQTPL